MTPAQFLELLISVSIQATIVVCVTHWLCQIVEIPRRQCRLWNSCNIILLFLLLSGVVLPHLRAVNPWGGVSLHVVERVVAAEAVMGKTVFIIWILGASVSLALLVREWIRAFRFLKSCRIANEQEMALIMPEEEASERKVSIRSKRPVQLLMSRQLGSPFCCQWHQPHLVIPEFMLKLRSDEVKYISRHELEHLRSGHPLQLFIERIVAIVFWFHPAVRWAAQQSSLAREYACDDAAAAKQREILGYLKVLLAVAERGLSEEAEGAKLFFGRGASVLALRGRRLLIRAQSAVSTKSPEGRRWAHAALLLLAMTAPFIWIPLDALAASGTKWSPWPQWSAQTLRAFNIPARDFEPYEVRTRPYELSASPGKLVRPESNPSATDESL